MSINIGLKQFTMVCPTVFSNLGFSPRMRRVNPVTPAAGPVGLINDGNTCYANAALQCILASALSKALLDPAYFDVYREINDQRNSPGFHLNHHQGIPNPSQLKLTESRLNRLKAQTEVCEWMLIELTKLCKNYTERSENEVWFGHNAIDPGHVTRHVKRLSSVLVWGRQEDAHEFLRAAISVLVMDGQNKQLSSLFDGLLESAVTCRTCGYSSLRRDRYMDLSLEITDSSVVDLSSALRAFTSTEYLGEDNMVTCDKCACKREVTKGLRLATAPTILVCHLKRFNINCYGQMVRLSKSIKFPMKLEIFEFMSLANRSQPPSYELVGVLVHQGRSCNYGHYLSYVKYCGEWYRCNDSKTEKVSETIVLAQNAYILVYEVEDIRHHKKPQPSSGGSVAVGRSHSFTTTSSANLQRTSSHPIRATESSSTKVSHVRGLSRSKTESVGGNDSSVFNFLANLDLCGGADSVQDETETNIGPQSFCVESRSRNSLQSDKYCALRLADECNNINYEKRILSSRAKRSLSSNDLRRAEEKAADAHRGRTRNRTDPIGTCKEPKKNTRASSTSRLKRLDSDSEGEATRRRRIGITPIITATRRRVRALSQGDVSSRVGRRPPRKEKCRPHSTKNDGNFGWP